MAHQVGKAPHVTDISDLSSHFYYNDSDNLDSEYQWYLFGWRKGESSENCP